jgi:hypothetical protein
MKRNCFLLLVWLLSVLTISAATYAAETPPPPPPPRTRAEVEAVLAKAPPAPSASELRPLNIVLLADEKDHGLNEHDYPLWQMRWNALLGGKAIPYHDRHKGLKGSQMRRCPITVVCMSNPHHVVC